MLTSSFRFISIKISNPQFFRYNMSSMKFSLLANYLGRLEKISSRLKITEILAELFNKSSEDEIDKTVYLLLGSLAPSYKNVVFNIAERMMLRALAQAYNQELKGIKDTYKKTGDLGDVVLTYARTKRLPPDQRSSRTGGKNKKTQELTVLGVHNWLIKIAEDEGEKSQGRKISKTAELLSKLDSTSAKFVARILIGKLRLGFSDKTILDALSWMKYGDKRAKKDLEKTYNVLPDVGLLAKSVKKFGIKKATENIKPVVGIPVLPMLAQRLKSPKEMIEKMREVAIEPKFDGLRIQIHFKSSGFKNGKKVKAYTRNLNETSWMFPELVDIGKFLGVNETILDCEAMGVDEKTKVLANFQTTMTRRRKHNIAKTVKNVGIKFYVFDILHKDGESLVDKTYVERREELEKSVAGKKLLEVVDYKITKNPKDIEKMMRMELSEGLEGVIVKRVDSRYVAGRTGWRWVKMKEEESAKAKLADTVDCIVMGYSVGKGRRAQFGVGQFLVGVRDKDRIKTISKIGTGITDEQFGELKKRLVKLEVGEKPKNYEVDKLLIPDYWVEPKLVVEVAADEITKSPSHTSKYALRFPRLIKFRDDKNVNQATSVREIKKLFELQ